LPFAMMGYSDRFCYRIVSKKSRGPRRATYCLELFLQVAELAGTIVGIFNVLVRNFQVAAGRSENEVDQVGHSA